MNGQAFALTKGRSSAGAPRWIFNRRGVGYGMARPGAGADGPGGALLPLDLASARPSPAQSSAPAAPDWRTLT